MTREEAIKILQGAIKKPNTKDGYLGQAIDMAIKALKPRKGHWIAFDSDEDKYDEIKCDCCKKEFTVDAYHWTDIGFTKDDLNFCPNCGADMREVEE